MEKTAPHGFRFFMDVAAVATANSAESSSVRGNSAVGTGHNQGGLYTASGSAWFVGTQDVEQWYQMDAGSVVSVVGVLTEGCSSNEWTTEYTVSCSANDTIWMPVDSGAVFVGNTNAVSPVRSMFASVVMAQ